MSIEGRTNSAATKAMRIINAVNIPKEENIGIGAMAIIAKPSIVDIAEPNSADPDCLTARSRAVFLLGAFSSSWRNLAVM